MASDAKKFSNLQVVRHVKCKSLQPRKPHRGGSVRHFLCSITQPSLSPTVAVECCFLLWIDTSR